MQESYHKLVRDKIPQHLDALRKSYEQSTATPEEYRARLIEKLKEEIGEFLEAQNSEELADVLEVIEALRKLPEFSDVERIKAEKLAEKGGFDKRIILKGKK